MGVHGMLVCGSFLISVCMFIVLKVIFISSATVLVRAVGAVWLNPFAMALFNAWLYLFSGPFSPRNYYTFSVCVYWCVFQCHNSFFVDQASWDLFYGGHLVCSSCSVSLIVKVPHEACVVQKRCESCCFE